MLPELPRPTPEPIERFSPTLANDLIACPLRVGFTRDPSFVKWRRPSTFSVLGDAAHAVAELVAKRHDWPTGRDERRQALVAEWDRCVSSGAAKLAAAWAPADPPPVDEWPSYQVTKTRTVRRAERAIAARGDGRRPQLAPDVESPDVAAGSEVDLVDLDSGLQGRADRIERVNGSYRVIDLKTGINQEDPKDEQLRQLLLYAVLVRRMTGEWPVDIAIENASGEQFVVPLEPEAAEAALADAREAVRSFNDRVASRAGDLEARASADTCRWCAYRVCCDAYWRNLTAEWGHASVLGGSVNAGGDGKGAYADLEVVSPTDLGATTAHLAGLPAVPPADSTWIAAVDLRPIRDPRSLTARWSTTILAW